MQYHRKAKSNRQTTVRVCSNVCALHCAQLLHTILHRTYLIISLLLSRQSPLLRWCLFEGSWHVFDVDASGHKGTVQWMRVHIGATWRIPLNRPCAAAMRHYVRLENRCTAVDDNFLFLFTDLLTKFLLWSILNWMSTRHTSNVQRYVLYGNIFACNFN